MTLRGIDQEVAKELKAKAAAQGKSINQLILDLIKAGLGIKKEKRHTREYDDLDHLFGRWSQDEFNEIQNKISSERRIDRELWQ